MSPAEEAALKKRWTENSEAYQLYLKGRYHWFKRTEDGFRRGIGYFEQAIQSDPAYAPAYVGLADSYNFMGFLSFVRPTEAFPKARSAALKALAVDEQLAEGHASFAYALHYHDWNWLEAEGEYKRALQLKDSYCETHQYYGDYLISMGRFQEAISEFERAKDLDPLSLHINTAVAWGYNFARRYDQSMPSYERLSNSMNISPQPICSWVRPTSEPGKTRKPSSIWKKQ